MVKLKKPKSWRSLKNTCSGTNSYCGHTQRQHQNGTGSCTVSHGESMCWCEAFNPLDDKKQDQLNLSRIARENLEALTNLAEIVDDRTKNTLLRIHRELLAATKSPQPSPGK